MSFFKFTVGARPKGKSSAADRSLQNVIQQRKHILNSKSGFHIREAYKTLRTNISFAVPKDGCCKVCVTSGLASEGKSITALNLALSFVVAGKRVLLIDGDLRRPNQARLLRMKGTPGLSNVLANLSTLDEVLNRNAYDRLDVIFAGDIPPNPSELLGTPRMAALLDVLSKHYDYIFIDTPPVNVVTDASVVARLTDGVLFVVRQGKSEYDSVAYAVNQLVFAESKILGFVLNGVKPETGARNSYKKYKKYSNYGYGRGYGYGKYGYQYSRHGYGYGYGSGSGAVTPHDFTVPPGGGDHRSDPEGGAHP